LSGYILVMIVGAAIRTANRPLRSEEQGGQRVEGEPAENR
jgi:hypothetical protein